MKRKLVQLINRFFLMFFLFPVSALCIFYSAYMLYFASGNIEKDIANFSDYAESLTDMNMSMIPSLYYKIISNPGINTTLRRENSEILSNVITSGGVLNNLKSTVFFDDGWNENLISFAAVYYNDEAYYYTSRTADLEAGKYSAETNIYNTTVLKKIPEWVDLYREQRLAGNYVGYLPERFTAPVICYIKDFYKSSNNEVAGSVVLGINSKKISEAFVSLNKYDGAVGVIYDRKNNVILASNITEWIGNQAGEISYRGKSFLNLINDKDYYTKEFKSISYDYVSVIVIPRKSVYILIQKPLRTVLGVIGIVWLIYFVVRRVFMKNVKQYLQKLEETFYSISTEQYEITIPESNILELEQVREHVTNMTQRIKQLISQDYNNKLLLREAEIRELQNQINPHFLFNVLLCINWNAKKNQDEETSEMLTVLSEYLNECLIPSEKQTVTLEEELDMVRYYLYLQKIRFGEKLKYDIFIEEEYLKKKQVPKLLLQPIIENSVVHGIEPKKGDGHILIHVWSDEGSLKIDITDDGVGYEEDTGESRQTKRRHHRIGVKNIQSRIRYIYGDEGYAKWKSSPGKGTVVRIRIPDK